MKTLDNINLKGKTILIRVDLNSSIIKNKIQNSLRFKEHGKTIKELTKKKAKTIILAHQGKKGEKDYLNTLKQHSKILSKITKKNIIYIDDLFGKKAIKSIKNMKNGDVILLKNTRSWKQETENLSSKEHSKGKFVNTLKEHVDIFIQDALSVCHRKHASVIGFPYVLPSYAGRVLQKELESINKINKKIKTPFNLILGGKKIEDYLDIIKKYNSKRKLNSILTTGILSLVVCISNGINLGYENKLLKKQGTLKLIPKIKPYRKKLITPTDFAININNKRKNLNINEFPSNYPILDIGEQTIRDYRKVIKNSKTIFVKGSAGNYEKKPFEKGTRELLKEIGKSKAFSLVGGGDTTTAITKYKIKGVNHISLSGGALLEYLAKGKLPGLEALK